MTRAQARRRPATARIGAGKGVSSRFKNRASKAKWWTRNWVICLSLAIATSALYGQVAGHEFIRFDDGYYVTQNLHVRAGLTWQTILWSLTSTESYNWHPVTWVSHALDCQLFDLWAGGHHLTSVLIHVLNAVLLFLLLRRATGKIGRSLVVAALFAWHPFNVESVAWVAERKNVLSTSFFFLTLMAYGWYAEKPHWKRYLLVVAFFILGLASKPMLVTLPFVLLLLDFWPLQRMKAWLSPSEEFPVPQRRFRWLVMEKLPLLLLAAASSVITMVAQHKTVVSVRNLPLATRTANALYSYLLYIWKMFWPVRFAVYYPHPFIPTPNNVPGAALYSRVVLAALLLVGVSLLVWRQRFTQPFLLVGWFWYVGTLVPVIGIVQVALQGMADRYAYVPMIGLFVMVAWGSVALAERLRIRPSVLRTAAVIGLGTLWLVTFRQIGFWRTNYDIWAHTLEVTDDNYVADDNMADALLSMGRPEWLQYFQHAASIAPSDAISHQAIAANLEDEGRLREAIQEYEVVVQSSPGTRFLTLAYANLGIIYSELGDQAKARAQFQQALQTDQRTVRDMIDTLTENVAKHPADEGYVRLGFLLEQTGRRAEARAACQKALTLKPDRMEALQCLDRLNAAGN
jgi:hypothetical protein